MEKKTTFYDLYSRAKNQKQISPAEKFIYEVARLVECSPMTVKLWIVGKQRPEKLKIRVIAEHFGVDPNGLFPDYKGMTARQALQGKGRRK